MKILELREKCREKEGERFDIKVKFIYILFSQVGIVANLLFNSIKSQTEKIRKKYLAGFS